MNDQVAVRETALETTNEFSNELAPTAGAEAARQEVQAAVILAKRFPRNEDEAYAAIIKACSRPSFAGDVEYNFPRGKKQDAQGNWVNNIISGPSVYLAREFARVWGNIRHGCDIVADTEGERTIRAFGWDIQTNVKVTSDVTFKKLIFRKQGGWQTPDERDLRELTNKQAAIAKRNCLLELLPSDMVEDACAQARQTLQDRAAQDPDGERKKVVTAFSKLNVTVEMLEQYLGHPLAQSSPAEIADLRSVYKSIADGNSTWGDYGAPTGNEMKEKTAEKAEELKKKLKKEPEPESPDAPEVTTEGEDEIIGLRRQIVTRVKELGGPDKLSGDSRREFERLGDLSPDDTAAFLRTLG